MTTKMETTKTAHFPSEADAVRYASDHGIDAWPYRGDGYPDWILLTTPNEPALRALPYPWAVQTDGTCLYLSEW